MSPKRHDQEFVQKTWTLALMCAKYCLLDVMDVFWELAQLSECVSDLK